MTKTASRNQDVTNLLNRILLDSKKSSGKYPEPFIQSEVESLFTSHIWGHREIMLTILVARLLDPKFKATKDFYACNPRAIYEHPIRTFLIKNGIPSRKSGPLNVAKNQQKIDMDWAANKRGDNIATNVAKIVRLVEKVSAETLYTFAVSFLKRYAQEAEKIKNLTYKPNPNTNPGFLTELCNTLIKSTPDGGSTPQLICGLILELGNLEKRADVTIEGHRDSVSTTNTTSEKPGDIIENLPNDESIIYEITVKKFDQNRMLESYEAVKAYDSKHPIETVYVICREEDVPQDIIKNKNNSPVLGYNTFQDISYYYISIFAWIELSITMFTPKTRVKLHEKLATYVNGTNTSEKVKILFKQLHTAQV